MNIKNICTAGFLAIVASCFAGQATAETWSPIGPFEMDSDSNRLKVRKGIVRLTCDLESAVEIDSSGKASVLAIETSGGIFFACSFGVSFNNLPYTMEGIKGMNGESDMVIIRDADIGTPDPGTGCFGDLIGEFNQITGEVTFNNAVVPAIAGDNGGDCMLTGTLTTTPNASFTNP